MNEIKELCQTYNQHLRDYGYIGSTRGNRVLDMKENIMDYLLEKNNPQDVLSLLGTQTSALKLTRLPEYAHSISYEQVLRERRSYWLRDVVIGIVLVLTFPISVPFLMTWSWATRGHINFFKSDGAIFVEKLRFLCEQANAQKGLAFLPIPTPNTSLRNTPVNDYKSLVPKVDLKPRVSSYTTPQARNDMPIFGAMLSDFFDPSSLLSDSGKPDLLSFRVRPFSYSADTFVSIDIFCEFRFIPNLSKGASLKILLDLRPGYLSAQTSTLSSLSLKATETQPTVKQSTDLLQTIHSYLFKPKPPETFETIYAAMQADHRDDYKNSHLALNLARNDTQRVMALECLINCLKHKYDHHCKRSEEEQVNVKNRSARLKLLNDYREGLYIPSSEEDKLGIEALIQEDEAPLRHHSLSLWEELLHQASYKAQNNANLSEKYLQELKDALNSLPANYHSITPSANQLQAKIDLMYRLLENNQIGDAKLLYRQNCHLSHFLDTAFPYFKAVLEQFRGMLSLVSQLGAYSMLECKDEPEDRELVKNELMIYYKANELWVAACSSDNQIHRFPIDNDKLGDEAGNLLYEFQKGEGNAQHSSILRPILADYGYYDIHWPSVVLAKECFEEAYNRIVDYDTALAERFKLETLGPVQALIDFGKEAKKHTPLDVQNQMIERHREQNRKQRVSGEISPQPSLLSDTAWDELLGDSVEILQQDDASNSLGIRF